MIGLLGQVNWEQTGTFMVAVIAALGGQKGLEALIVAWRGRGGPSRSDKPGVEPGTCPEHAGLVKLLDERNDGIIRGMEKIEGAIYRLHERIDAFIEHKIPS